MCDSGGHQVTGYSDLHCHLGGGGTVDPANSWDVWQERRDLGFAPEVPMPVESFEKIYARYMSRIGLDCLSLRSFVGVDLGPVGAAVVAAAERASRSGVPALVIRCGVNPDRCRDDFHAYFVAIREGVVRARALGVTVRIALSIPRNRIAESPAIIAEVAGPIRDHIDAVDLGGSEICPDHPDPETVRRALVSFRGALGGHLELLVHAGESLVDYPWRTGLRRILDAVRAGATRIGHAYLVRFDPQYLTNRKFVSRLLGSLPRCELEAQAAFERSILSPRNGAPPWLRRDAEDQLERLERAWNGRDDSEWAGGEDAVVYEARKTFVLRKMAESGVEVEICPSSTLLMNGRNALAMESVDQVRMSGVSCVIATDNAGMLGTDLPGEHALCHESWGPEFAAWTLERRTVASSDRAE